MRLGIVVAGRMRAGPERLLFDRYAKMLRDEIFVREIEERRKLPPAALKRAEAALIRAAIPDGAATVALDRLGRAATSEELARRLAGWRDGGRTVAFLIGGAEGLDEDLRQNADWVLSFGAATWPHLLVRVMLIEQLYRAQTILAGHPYHRAG
jgi:23S rRNA (pseudouridine1915-N3)-methyltransferase